MITYRVFLTSLLIFLKIFKSLAALIFQVKTRLPCTADGNITTQKTMTHT